MGKAAGLLLAVLGFGTASYVMTAPDTERAATDKLATLVRIAAEGTRTVAQSGARTERDTARGQPRRTLIADQPSGGRSEENSAGPKTEMKLRLPLIAQAVVPDQSPSAGNDQNPRRNSVKPVDDEARRALSRSIQSELKRVGCFDGELDGAWNTATRASLKTFVDRINATLPVNEPDYILLTLLQGHSGRACGKDCPTGQLLANDGRCLPKAIVAQADRKVPQRATVAQSTVAQPALEAGTRDRRADFDAQLRIAEDNRAKALAEAERKRALEEQQQEAARQVLAVRQAEIQAKAEAERRVQLRAVEALRQKNEAAAADAHRKQMAIEDENRSKVEAQRAAQSRLLDEQRTKAEAAAEEVRRRQLALAEQKRQAELRVAEQQRSKDAAAEEARRRQLVSEQQQRTKADAQRLALAVAAEDQRMKAAAALEEARRRQLVLDQRNSKNDIARNQTPPLQGMPSIAVAQAPQPQASNPFPASTQAMASLSIVPQAMPSAPPAQAAPAATAPAATVPAETRSVPFITGSTAPASSEPAAPSLPVLVANPAPAPLPKAVAQPQKAVRVAPPRHPQRNQDPAPRPQQPRYVQRFVPPSYVGRSNPSPAPRAVYYKPSAPSYNGGGGSVFSNISRSAP